MIGKTISHYKILDKLGEGGLGVVYKAEDVKLKRPVALKFLSPELSRDSDSKERFVNEARAASALDHSNICTIYEIGETEDGQLFIAMAFYEGESLRAKIREGTIDLDEAVGIATQIAGGLAAAHGKGIVHRDIKPANIMIASDGTAKIIDFGLAMLAGQMRLTKTGMTSGTAAYMSPEQARGEHLDHRTDIWSLGVVLYELVTGQLPFRGDYETALIYSILNDRPKPMSSVRSGVPSELERVANKALTKNLDDRYKSMNELLDDLRALCESQKSKVRQPRARESTPRKKSIAVLPFRSLSDSKEDEYFSDGTTEDIITQLSKIGDLRVISRTSIMRYKNADKTIPEIGRELGVATILEGSVRRAGERVRIVAQLLDVRTDEHMWAETYDREMKDVFAIQSEVAEKIANALGARLSRVEKKRIEKKPTENMEAYNYYLKGRFYWNKRRGDDLKTAVEYFKRAIELDPDYALAYAGLASTYTVYPDHTGLSPKEFIPKARVAAEKALELDASLAEPHAVLGMIKASFEWDWAGSESEYKRAIELDPSYPTAHHWYSLLLADHGRVDEAWAEVKRAQELDPLSLIINVVMGLGLYVTRQYDKAVEQFKKTLELDPNFIPARVNLGRTYLEQVKLAEAIEEFEKIEALVEGFPYVRALLGSAYARAGRKNDAAKIINELIQLHEQGSKRSYDIALVYCALGEKEQVLNWLERAYEERDPNTTEIRTVPVWDALRSDPRFVAIVEKIAHIK